MSNPIIMLAGLPGGGKSTVGEKLENRLEYDRHTVTDIRRELGHKRWHPGQNSRIFQMLNDRTAQSAKEGSGVIVENAYPSQHSRSFTYGISQMFGVEIIIIECYCSEALAKRRIRARPPRTDGLVSNPRNPKAYDRLKAKWQDINDDLNVFSNFPISYLKYDSETNQLKEVYIRDSVRSVVGIIKQTIL